MMSDIVERLRARSNGADFLSAAADEIERLRLEATALREKYYRRDDELADLRRRIGEALNTHP